MQHHAYFLYCISLCVFVFSADSVGWEKGVKYAEGQNLARLLMEAPANHITPTAFANTIEEKLAPHAERVTINKRFVLHSSCPTKFPRTAVFQFRHKKCTVQPFIYYVVEVSWTNTLSHFRSVPWHVFMALWGKWMQLLLNTVPRYWAAVMDRPFAWWLDKY